jgi:hypothetical protein
MADVDAHSSHNQLVLLLQNSSNVLLAGTRAFREG